MEKYDITRPVILKKGVYKLNDEANFNYQLNRVINWDGGRLEDVQKVSGKIHNSDDWKRDQHAKECQKPYISPVY